MSEQQSGCIHRSMLTRRTFSSSAFAASKLEIETHNIKDNAKDAEVSET